MFRNGDAIDGVGPELVRMIFSDLGIDVESRHLGTWDQALAQVLNGDIDMLVGAYKTSSREPFLAFSDAFSVDPIAVYVATGNAFELDASWTALIGRRGIAMVGDSYGETFDTFAEANLDLVRVSTVAEGLALVESGQADYFIYSLYSGEAYLKASGETAKFESLSTLIHEEPFHLAVSRQSPFVDFMPQINAAIARYKADGTIDRLMEKYRG